jgi:hypothetical protein
MKSPEGIFPTGPLEIMLDARAVVKDDPLEILISPSRLVSPKSAVIVSCVAEGEAAPVAVIRMQGDICFIYPVLVTGFLEIALPGKRVAEVKEPYVSIVAKDIVKSNRYVITTGKIVVSTWIADVYPFHSDLSVGVTPTRCGHPSQEEEHCQD